MSGELFDTASSLYREARLLLEETREAAVAADQLRWHREDLEESLLDLKLALIDRDRERLLTYTQECSEIMGSIFRWIRDKMGE